MKRLFSVLVILLIVAAGVSYAFKSDKAGRQATTYYYKNATTSGWQSSGNWQSTPAGFECSSGDVPCSITITSGQSLQTVLNSFSSVNDMVADPRVESRE